MGFGSGNVAFGNNITHLLKDLDYLISVMAYAGKEPKREWIYLYV